MRCAGHRPPANRSRRRRAASPGSGPRRSCQDTGSAGSRPGRLSPGAAAHAANQRLKHVMAPARNCSAHTQALRLGPVGIGGRFLEEKADALAGDRRGDLRDRRGRRGRRSWLAERRPSLRAATRTGGRLEHDCDDECVHSRFRIPRGASAPSSGSERSKLMWRLLLRWDPAVRVWGAGRGPAAPDADLARPRLSALALSAACQPWWLVHPATGQHGGSRGGGARGLEHTSRWLVSNRTRGV